MSGVVVDEQQVRRDRPLDGLRGLAAVIVVVSHVTIVSPMINNALTRPASFGSGGWLWTNTPLLLLICGSSAVRVFFVLSGYVLVLQLLKEGSGAAGWRGYYPRRLMRLYLPAWAALMLGVLLDAAFSHRSVSGASGWLNAHSAPVTVTGFLHDASLVQGTGWIVSPLWLLRWEVVFSLLLPAYYAFATLARRAWLLKIAACGLMIFEGQLTGRQGLLWLPLFGLGSVLAVERVAVARALSKTSGRGMGALLCLTLLGLTAQGLVWQGTYPPHEDFIYSVAVTLAAASASSLVALVTAPHTMARRVCSSSIAQWLGKVSFSLYLVHEPIVVAIAFLLGGRPSLLLLSILAVPVSFVVAVSFMRVVDIPATKLSRRVGRWASDTAGSFAPGRMVRQPVIERQTSSRL